MGRAATILKSCSSGRNRENAAQIFIFLKLGVTRVTWRRQVATAAISIHRAKLKRRKAKQKRKFGSEQRIVLISGTHASRNGHNATAAARKRDRQSKCAGKIE